MPNVKKKKIIRLKNRYTGSIVVTENYEKYTETNGVKFIRVHDESNPNRSYLVNREAFEIIT